MLYSVLLKFTSFAFTNIKFHSHVYSNLDDDDGVEYAVQNENVEEYDDPNDSNDA